MRRSVIAAVACALALQACATKPNGDVDVAKTAANVLIGTLIVGAAVAIGKRGGGGGGGAAAVSGPTYDYDWAWDQFMAADGQLVWACRGKQTGQFAHVERCAGRVQADTTWPGFTLR